MANQEQLELLKQGVEVWNRWRTENQKVEIDLSFADLSGASLGEANLSGVNLTRVNFSGASLSRANLGGSNLSDANLSRTFLIEVYLEYANLSRANLWCILSAQGANFGSTNLSQANFRGANLYHVNFFAAFLAHANLSDSFLEDSNFRDANLSHANLCRAKLRDAFLGGAYFGGANLSRADLSGVDLRETVLQDANFNGADLRGANLSGMRLKRQCFKEANLSYAYFCKSNLSEANLAGASLISTNFVNANLSKVNLFGADLRDANLQGACLYEAYLVKANLQRAVLAWADLKNADLLGATLIQATLCNATLAHSNLFKASLQKADLRQANLRESDLSKANLNQANISDSVFYKADFSGANFCKVEALGTDLSRAILTGVCIEDWNTNSATNLERVVCEYVHLKKTNQERRPSSGNFVPGEFTKLFQKALETVDLIFADGINWNAFFQSFQELRSQYNDENLAIQAIEKKSGGAFVIRLEVPPEADKAVIESQVKEPYEMKLKLLETQYRTELHAKDREIEIYKQQNTDMLEIVKLQASRPIHTTAIAGSQLMGDRNIQMGSGNYNECIEGNYVQGNYINMSQDLTQAAQQIQDLLHQLQNQGVTVEDSQYQVSTDIAKQAETNPVMMGKLVLWGKAMANKASETTVSEAAKIVFTLALKAAGLPFP